MHVRLVVERAAAAALGSPGRTSMCALSRALAQQLAHAPTHGRAPLLLRLTAQDAAEADPAAVAYVLWNGRELPATESGAAVGLAAVVCEGFGLVSASDALTTPRGLQSSRAAECKLTVVCNTADAPVAERVVCAAASSSDFTLARAYADILTERMLPQLAVVWRGAVLTVWVTPTMHVRLIVRDIVLRSSGRIPAQLAAECVSACVCVISDTTELAVEPAASLSPSHVASNRAGSTTASPRPPSEPSSEDGPRLRATLFARTCVCVCARARARGASVPCTCDRLCLRLRQPAWQLLCGNETTSVSSIVRVRFLGAPPGTSVLWPVSRDAGEGEGEVGEGELYSDGRCHVMCSRRALTALLFHMLATQPDSAAWVEVGNAASVKVELCAASCRPLPGPHSGLALRPLLRLAHACDCDLLSSVEPATVPECLPTASACRVPCPTLLPAPRPRNLCRHGSEYVGALALPPPHADVATFCMDSQTWLGATALAVPPERHDDPPATLCVLEPIVVGDAHHAPVGTSEVLQAVSAAYKQVQAVLPPLIPEVAAHECIHEFASQLHKAATAVLSTQLRCATAGVRAPGGHIVVTGGAGSGKSTLLRCVQAYATTADHACFEHIEFVKCRAFLGDTPGAVQSGLAEAWKRCTQHAPALLLLDDLHVLLHDASDASSAGAEEPAAAQARRHEAYLSSLFDGCDAEGVFPDSDPPRVLVISTGAQSQPLPRTFERRWFGCTATMPVWSAEALQDVVRQSLQEAWATTQSGAPLDLSGAGLADELDADTARRLTVHDAHRIGAQTAMLLFSQQCDGKDGFAVRAALHRCIRDVGALPVAGDGVDAWTDIGGMFRAKRALEESLILRIRHRTLLKLAPIRLPRGFLLFGPPGCGKTMLARAIAAYVNLIPVFVKGPEVMSKYIGASEAGVRDVFTRAAACAPSVIIFDELEAVAPRRSGGAAGTGVTDRIVNQLLTFLDGVEAVPDDVFVMATTSRPDMLDPALLRPGRFDKHVYCGVPTPAERVDIVKSLLPRFSCDASAAAAVPILAACSDCDGFTPADLKACLTTASIAAARDESMEPHAAEHVAVITLHHLAQAFSEARPSLTRANRLAYERICAPFVADDDVSAAHHARTGSSSHPQSGVGLRSALA